jgi:hypothetical protein
MAKYLELTRDVMSVIRRRREHQGSNHIISPFNPIALASSGTSAGASKEPRYGSEWEGEEEGEP